MPSQVAALSSAQKSLTLSQLGSLPDDLSIYSKVKPVNAVAENSKISNIKISTVKLQIVKWWYAVPSVYLRNTKNSTFPS